jgi:hypothetical protein
MRKILTVSAGALALAATTVAAVAPADAQRWRGGHRGYYRGGDRTGVAIGAGILGLAAGAAIASSNRGYYGGGYGYGGGYYGGPAYYGGPGYYAPPPPQGYYGRGYCRSDWRWDGWARRYVRVRYCD